MSQTVDTIVQELHADFESMLNYVKNSHTATADQMERGLFRRLLNLGLRLMLLFFALRTGAAVRDEHQVDQGEPLPYWAEHRRQYFSIFGKLAFWRPYFYRPGAGGVSPLDQELGLGSDCYSDLVRELVEYLGVDSTYAKVANCFVRLLGLGLSTQAISDLVAEDAAEVEAFYAQLPPPPASSEAALLVIQADGKGVPMLRPTPAAPPVRLGKGEKPNRKKEAVVTGLYTIASQPRTPAEVVASLFHPERTPVAPPAPRTGPQNKRLWATLAGKDAAFERLAQQVASREGAHIQQRVALTDGAEALQDRVQLHFPDFTLVLDFIHADEKLWDAANCLFGETAAQRIPWVEAQTLEMLTGQVPQVITELRRLAHLADATATQKTVLTKIANYYERNLPFMHYDQYLTNGWPIASGVIEGACRHLVKDRCQLSGMRWTQAGVENLLRLRAVAENDDWTAYRSFLQAQRHQRLYNVPWPAQDVLENQVMTDPMAPLSVGHAFVMPTIVAQRNDSEGRLTEPNQF
jgi:hypothetical protein